MKKLLLFIIVLNVFSFGLYAQWEEQSTGFSTASTGLWNISIVDADIVWGSATDGTTGSPIQEFSKTVNGGLNWTPGTFNGVPTDAATSELFAISENIAWLVTNGNTAGGQTVFKTTDGGANWSAQATAEFAGSAAFANTIYFWDENNGTCFGDPNPDYFEHYTTTDGGTTWTRVPTGDLPAPLSGEYGYNGGSDYDVVGDIVWFGTNNGRVLKSTDRGLTWSVYTTGLTEVERIDFKDENNGLIVYSGGGPPVVERTTDGGETWTPVTFTGMMVSGDLHYAHGTPGYYVCTGQNGSAYSLDDGDSWIDIDATQHTSLDFLSNEIGWSGGFTTDATTGGVSKWTGGVFVDKTPANSNDMYIYPNPNNGQFNITINNIKNEDVQLYIYDVLGKIVYYSGDSNSGYIYKSIDLSDLSKGLYIVDVLKGKEKFQEKLIIK